MKLFIFGSTGDLVNRKVLPALQNFNSEKLEIYAIGRKNITQEKYLHHVCSEDRCTPIFQESIKYIKLNFDKEDICGKKCIANFDQNKTNYVYISLPPSQIKKILYSLKKFKELNYSIKILIEKPFGSNLLEAKELKQLIEENNLGKDIFLSDHYLFKQNIINLPKQDFTKLEIKSTEEVGLEGRTTYYNSVGALKDMVQSHFLNITQKISKEELKDKIEILEFKRGQYKNYSKELGKKSIIETFVKLKLKLNNKELIFTTGKALNQKESFLTINRTKYKFGIGNEYLEIFKKFINNEKNFFPTIEQAIKSWEIIEEIEKKKPDLFYYDNTYLF